jgi:nucleotide-binding universal stress UspA family protein
MTSRIFVGYDGTAASIAAVKWAVDEARLRQARLHIVTCYDIPATGDAAYGAAPREDFEASFLAARRAAHEMQEAIEFEEPGVEVAVQITAGSPAMELLAEAATRDLIVIGASRHHRTQAILFGSTGRQLARHQTCPLVVVRVARGEGPSTRVVAGVDGSSGALPAVRWAADEAERRRVDLRLLHMWEPHDVSREKAEAMLEVAQLSIGNREALSVQTDVVERFPQLRFADILAPDELLVIGSHARGRLKTALFGSTVNNLIEESPGTVVIVPRQRSE